MSYIGPTALEALWTKLVALLAGKADRTSVYSKSEINYLMATHDWGNFATISGSGSGSSNTSDCVHLTGTETISGVKTFSAAGNVFYSGGLKVRSTNTSYYATIANQAGANITVYLPTNTSNGSQYLLSRQTSATTANTIPYYSGSNGAMGTKTIATSTLNDSTNEIPTSAAIIAYLRELGIIQ